MEINLIIMILIGLLVAGVAGVIGYQIKAKDCPSCPLYPICPKPPGGNTWTKDQMDKLSVYVSSILKPKNVPQEGISCAVQTIANMMSFDDFNGLQNAPEKAYLMDVVYNLCLGPKGRWAEWIKAQYVQLMKNHLGVSQIVAQCIVNNLERMYSGSIGTPIANNIYQKLPVPDEVSRMIKGCGCETCQ